MVSHGETYGEAMKLGNLLKNMGADVASLERSRYSRAQREAVQFEAQAKRAGLTPEVASQLALNLLAHTPKPDKTEPFIMLTASQNAEVVRWINANSKRPQVATMLWALLFTAVHPTTGEILLARADLAERLGIEPRNVSSIMTELVSIGAVQREKRGREVRYFMSPHIATHLPVGEQLAEARTKAPKLRLVQSAEGSEREALEAAGQMRLLD